MKNVQVPHEYFNKALLEYSDWHYAWFREVIQNSVDANATQIDFLINLVENKLIVEVTDNGHGMDKDTLENVFLTLGGSQKAAKSIGGFGYAKTVIAFAHNKYKIHTQDNLVLGTGGSYKIKDTSFLEGTYIKVDMTCENNKLCYLTLENRLSTLCDNYYRSPDLTITLNGNEMARPNKKLGGKRSVEGLGSLKYARIEGNTAKTWVTVKGLPMFSLSLQSTRPIVGYIELKGNPIDILTANRDGLKHEYSGKLYEIVNLLANDNGKLDIEPMIDILINPYLILGSEPKVHLKPEDEGYEKIITQYRISTPIVTNYQSPDMGKRELATLNKLVDKHVDQWLTSIDKVKWPDNFRFMVKEKESAYCRSRCKTKKIIRLAYIWKVAVCAVLQSIYKREDFPSVTVMSSDKELDWYDENVCFQFMCSDRPISYGFIFDSNIEGLNSKKTNSIDNSIAILMNPLLLDEDWYIGDILDLAIHEITHCFVSSHDESWVLTNEMIRKYVRRSLDRERDILDWAKDLYKRVN